MRFTKMHGAGNDYIFVNCFEDEFPSNPSELARQMTDRHFGIGGDGLILVCPSERADARMRMFNADGSEAEMCGNGIRCLAKLVYEQGIALKQVLAIETGAGIVSIHLRVEDEQVNSARVDMGEPILDSSKIPTRLDGNPVVNVPLSVGHDEIRVTCVSMGNPHCIVFVDEPHDNWVLGVGPQIEVDPHFPARVNVEFVQVLSRTEMRQRTWERGSGETLACGTGASAVCVAGVLTGQTDRHVQIHLKGGDLDLAWNESDNHVYMTGPAVEVFRGSYSRAD